MRKALLALFVLGLTSAASANPVIWTLNGVTFTDGGTASGSFVYNADTNTYSSVNITTTAGSVIVTGATLLYVVPAFSSSGGVLTAASNAADLTGARAFALNFGTALTNNGGTVTLLGQEASCANATCSGPAAPSRNTNAGSVSGTSAFAVPALSPWAMAVTGLLLVAAAFVALRKGAF
ncbi:MAG TPA: hypothetical protein VGM13_01315 [Thermoanaerobaculia bacterium]|jgi:hypothetical protein